MSNYEYANDAQRSAYLQNMLLSMAAQQDKERALWFRRAADLSSTLRAVIHNYEVLLGELGHDDHATETDPETMCLDCYGLREAKALLEWEVPR